ncbi:IclR family transcriptional regulator [Pseudoglutamicibacter cumminsii]|uniref:IclR family transcriptional regulator n=1 Tax=Pseudoglutamicibacter cumminsii TaxID=156979 RepID=UPI001956F4F8|nr:IclR family transcriptional regulator [Pseudoglutamicibacter cumminsii]MBM7795805.1 DNA-binding IclR family transcriptional regulator [Pseudoglutamicibacter cumminsii]
MANSPSGESVLQRISKILGCFDQEKPVLSAAQIARLTGISRSTTYRMLHELEHEGFLRRTSEGTYAIGLKLWEYGVRASGYEYLGRLSRPFLQGIHETLNVNVSLAVLDHDDGSIIYLERAGDLNPEQDLTEVAGRLPALLTATGLVLIAFSDPKVWERTLREVTEEQLTQINTTRKQLRSLLAKVKSEGFCHLSGVLVKSSTGTAVPVFGPHRELLGALTFVTKARDVDLRSQLPVLISAARSLGLAASPN